MNTIEKSSALLLACGSFSSVALGDCDLSSSSKLFPINSLRDEEE